MSEVENSAALEEAVQDVHILKKVRLEKLDELKVKHENPYEITKYPVDAHNAELKAAFEKEEARMIAEAAAMRKSSMRCWRPRRKRSCTLPAEL